MQISSSWGRKGYQTESRARFVESKKTISSSSDLLARKKHFPYEKDEEIEDEFGRMERKKPLYILHMCAENNNTDCKSSVWI